MEISERIRYVDQLRAVSILFLIAINVAMVFKYKSVGNLQEYVVFTTFGFGVPIFLMLLGLLMLDRDYSDIETFIKTDFSNAVALNSLKDLLILNLYLKIYYLETLMNKA